MAHTLPAPAPLPGAHLDLAKMPGHWVLARMGKRVLRPGGLELTGRMLDALGIDGLDRVVELAPGLGLTARLTLARQPATYTAIERDPAAAAHVRQALRDPRDRCVQGSAEATGLPDRSATVVYGEAMLSMQTPAQKNAIVREAFRVLAPGGRYALHEMSMVPDCVPDAAKEAAMRDLSAAIHVGARPLTPGEWREVLERAGFRIERVMLAPMHLLEPARVIRDEGLLRSLRVLFNVLRTPVARRRVMEMRRVFHKHREHLGAIAIVAVKPLDGAAR